jgi:nicotinamidase-related amidase
MSTPDSVVIVIDLQTGMFDGVAEPPLHDADGLTERTRAVLAWARRTDRKVAFIRHDGDPADSLAPGKPGWPVWAALGQAADEPTFSKNVGDSFSNPALGEWVSAAGTKDVILLGAMTDMCVAATVGGALERGYGVTVVGDTHSSVAWSQETVPDVIARHNADFVAKGAKVVTAADLTGG